MATVTYTYSCFNVGVPCDSEVNHLSSEYIKC